MYQSKGLKFVNIQQVKDYLVENKIATKKDIVDATGLSTATITNILKELLDSCYIERLEDCASTGGRKAKRYQICGHYMYFGLLHLQMFNHVVQVQFRIIDLDDVIVADYDQTFKTFTPKTLRKVVKDMKERFAFSHLSISVPGIVEDGKITNCNIESLNEFDVESLLGSDLKLRVRAENDVNTAMLGYIHSHVLDDKTIAFVYQPDNHNSGCGLYINNGIVYGATHFAGELGFLPNGTLHEQARMLETNPLKLLIKQVVSIIALVNPSHMILYTPCVRQPGFLESIAKHIPPRHLPAFIFIDNMDEFVFKGLTTLCVESARFKI